MSVAVDRVVGIDNLNDCPDVNLRRARLARMVSDPGVALMTAITDDVARLVVRDKDHHAAG